MDESAGRRSMDSWLVRAIAEGKPTAAASADSEAAAPTISSRLSDGWDPKEVWLRRIHQPRQGLSAVAVNLSDTTP
jgi:hypothetical protein